MLTIDLSAIAANWRSLNAFSRTETGAVVKSEAYGLDAARVGETLAKAGARQFFVALAEEGVALRRALGPGPAIHVLSGHMDGDAPLIRNNQLTPVVNSVDQLLRHIEALGTAPFGVQLDTGMNRLGMEPAEWAAVRDIALRQKPVLLMSHLACADEPDHPMNLAQRDQFHQMTDGVGVPRSLAATGGLLLHPDYHFDLTRPGIGLYGGAPYAQAQPVVTLDIPVVQVRDVGVGETVGYANAWTAERPSRIATISAGYADGLIRSMGRGVNVFVGDVACPVVGRVSMDLITVDVTDLDHDPEQVQLIGPHQGIDAVADAAGTIGYEILTALGTRYNRAYVT